jgi:hypothetical protein
MSFEFIDLTESFQKIVTEKFTTILIDHLRGDTEADNIHPHYKENWGLSIFYT